MNADSWQTAWLTLELAGTTALILLLIGTPLAWWLATTASRWRTLVRTLVALPLVLPPTVLGFYLLLLFSPRHGPGQWLAALGLPALAFSFSGLVLASVIYSLPFTVQPLVSAFSAIGRRPFEVAATLGAGPLDRFFSVALPLARPGLFSAFVLTFAHTIGEFGVVLMVGGNLPGQTRVLSIAIYDQVESLHYSQAHWMSALLLAFSFVALLLIHVGDRRQRHLLESVSHAG